MAKKKHVVAGIFKFVKPNSTSADDIRTIFSSNPELKEMEYGINIDSANNTWLSFFGDLDNTTDGEAGGIICGMLAEIKKAGYRIEWPMSACKLTSIDGEGEFQKTDSIDMTQMCYRSAVEENF